MVGYGGKDLQQRKVLSLEWKSEGVMDDESGESMEPMEEVPGDKVRGESRDRWIMRLCVRIILRIIGDLPHNWANPA